jgi:hypothetical protein
MTRTDLYRKALEKLKIAAAGEPVQPEDVQLVEDKYVSVYALLAAESLVSWGATDDIPDEAGIPMTDILACACAVEFSKPQDMLEGAIALHPKLGGPSRAETQLRRLLHRPYIYTRSRPEYF